METVEYDSDDEDPGADLSSWLQKLCRPGTTDAEQSGDFSNTARSTGKGLLTQSDTVESFRYSVMMDNGNAGGCDLDDIISDLCALEAQLTSECVSGTGTPNNAAKFPLGPATEATAIASNSLAADEAYESRSSTTSSANSSLSRESGTRYLNEHQLSRRGTPLGPAVLTPGVPVPVQKAAEKCAAGERWSAATTSAAAPAVPLSATATDDDRSPSDCSRVNSEARTKEEKIMLAIQKIKDADIKKLFVKVFIENGDCKTLLIDESMTTYDVIQMLFEKCPAFKANVRWAVIEQIPDLFIERIIEDHERPVFVMLNWLKVSNNRVLFLQTDDKYDLFFQPQNYLLEKKAAAAGCSEKDQKGLLDDLFRGAACPAPELESDLHVKVDGQKSWKKISAVLRSSGIYMKKGKAARSALQCIVQFDQMDVYRGFGWKKKHKAPSEHCFALKRAEVQKKSKDCTGMKYFCCDDDYTLKRWLTGLRIVKYGTVLNENFRRMVDLVAASGTADGDRALSSQGSGLVGLRTETASHGSRDSGFSIASGGSSGSLEGGGGSAASMPAMPPAAPATRHVPPPPLEFSDLPPPPPELLNSACSTPAMSKRVALASSTAHSSPTLLRLAASDEWPQNAARGTSSPTAGGATSGAYSSSRLLPPTAVSYSAGGALPGCGTLLAAASRNSAASSSSSASSSGSTPSNSVQSLNATDSPSTALLLPRSQQTNSPPAVPAKPRVSVVGAGVQLDRGHVQHHRQQLPVHRSNSSTSTSAAEHCVRAKEAPADLNAPAAAKAEQQSPVRASFDRLDPCRRTCPATPKRTVSIKQPAQAGTEVSADQPQLLIHGSPDRSSADAFCRSPLPQPQPASGVGRPAVAAKPSVPSISNVPGGRLIAAAAPETALRPSRTSEVSGVNFLEELSTVYAKRSLTKPAVPATPAAFAAAQLLCDIDDLPPPPPELLLDQPTAQQPASHVNHRQLDATTAVIPSGSDKLHFNMGQVFASQTGTIKRAPPPPPKRQDTVAAVAATGNSANMHAQHR